MSKRFSGRSERTLRTMCAAAGVLATALSGSSHAAENRIANGDFEASAGVGMRWGHYAYANESGGLPPSWNLSPAGRTGLLNRDYTGVAALGKRMLFFERRRNETTALEASQRFTIPAPGAYRLSLDYSCWNADTRYDIMTLHADVIGPDGAVTNRVMDFRPPNRTSDASSVAHASFRSARLADFGADAAYTLRFHMTDSTSLQYGYNVIDNIDFSLYTLALEEGESFTGPASLEPHEISLAENSTLTLVADSGAASIDGCIQFAEGSKIVIDLSSLDGAQHVFRTGGMIFPEGAEGPAQFFALSGGEGFSLHFIEDGKTVLASKASAPFRAEWTGAGDSATLLDPANWTCRNFAGEAVSGVPCGDTLELKLGADADWRVSGAPAVSPFAALDLNGHALSLSGLSPAEFAGERIFSSSAATLSVSVEEGESVNSTIALAGAVKLVKDGAGTLVAAKAGQSYTGGTEIAGVVKCGIDGSERMFGMGGPNLVANGDFEGNNRARDEQYSYTKGISGGIAGWQVDNTGDTGLFNAYSFWTLRGGSYSTFPLCGCYPEYEKAMFALFLGRGSNASQTIRVDAPGLYGLSFRYGTWVGARLYNGALTAVQLLRGGELVFSARVTPEAKIGYRPFGALVRMDEAGDYTLRFSTAEAGAGTYITIDDVSFAPCAEVAVGSGSALELNGKDDLSGCSISLAGGELRNSAADAGTSRALVAALSLSSDSSFVPSFSHGIASPGEMSVLDLAGNALTVPLAVGKTFFLHGVAVTAGAVNIASGGWTEIGGEGVSAAEAGFTVASALRVNARFDVGDYTAVYSADYNAGTAAMNVHGRFTPASDYFYGCTMQDGSTIDLSAKTAAWPVKSAFSSGRNTVDFAAGANVNIDVGERQLSAGDKLVAWTRPPDPADGVSFAIVRGDAPCDGFALSVRADGVYAARAGTPLYARWSVEDGGWKFFGADDEVVEGWEEGVTGGMQVRFASVEEYDAIKAAGVSPAMYVLTGGFAIPAGRGTLDMATGFAFDYPSGIVIDVNGETLKMPEYMIGGARPLTVTSGVKGGTLVATVDGAAANSAVTITGGLKFVKEGAGTFTAAKAGQTYTGGTEVTDGTLKLGANAAFGALANLVVNGDFSGESVGNDAARWSAPAGWTCKSAGNWWVGVSRGNNIYVNASPSGNCMIMDVRHDSGDVSAEQSITVEDAGDYRLSFLYAGSSRLPGAIADVTLSGDGKERLLATLTGTTSSFRWHVAQVRIDNPGTYVLKFHLRPSQDEKCMGFDDIVFAKCVDVAVVGEDAVLDMNGQYNSTVDYTYRLAGGTLTSGAALDSAWTKAMLRDVRVEADSKMSFPQPYGMIAHYYGDAFVDLGGKTLTLDSSASTFYFSGTTFTEGTLSIDGGYVELYNNLVTNDFRRAKVVMNGNSVLRCSSNCAVPLFGDLEVNSTSSDASTAYPVGIKVFGTFKPNTDNFHGCELQDGATLDLSGRVGAFSTKGAYAGGTAAQTTVTFAKDAAVTIDLHGRRDLSSFRKGAGRVVEWEAGAAPDGVAFSLDEATGKRGYRIEQVEGGLSLSTTGMLLIFR